MSQSMTSCQPYIKPKCCKKTTVEVINDVYGRATEPIFPSAIKGSIHIVQYTDALVFYVKGTDGVWTETIELPVGELRVSLNDSTPTFTPLDVNNPTIAEVDTWVTTNLSALELNNGTQVVYFVPGDGGSNDDPDYIWTLNNGEITLSNKRVFNTKTVYVDAGSGSDVTGKRGYRDFPFKTLNAAITAIQEDDTLHIFPGDYVITVDTPTKTFGYHINSDLGANVELQTETSKFLINTTATVKTYNLIFDRLYNTVFASFSINSRGISIAARVNFSANSLEYSNIIIRDNIIESVNIKNQINSWIFRRSVGSSPTTGSNGTVNIENAVSGFTNAGGAGHVVTPSSDPLTNFYTKISNLKTDVKVSMTNQSILGLTSGSDTGTDKKYSLSIDNLEYRNDFIYVSTPLLYDPVNTWIAGQTNQGFFIRTSLKNNTQLTLDLNNVISYSNLIYVQNQNKSYQNYSIKGVAKKGISYLQEDFGGDLEVVTHLYIDIVSEDCHAIDLSSLTTQGLITISGRIKVLKAGFPCISIRSGVPTQRIILKDLTLINDGTVDTVMTNSVTPIGVLIQNVVSNSTVVDPNITEVGQSITRNVLYK